MEPLRVFIGWDTRESMAYHVLSHSILTRTSRPVSIQPVMRSQLLGLYTRERGPTESTEFTLSRFLVPYLAGHRGKAIFMDCDMLCRADIGELADLTVTGAAVSVCQHDYVPKTATKFLNQAQTVYPRKNWSSLMVFDCAHLGARQLTPEYVNSASPADLHRFMWAREAIGAIPLEWNWLVGEYPPNPAAKMLHYTLGGPWFDPQCDHAEDWMQEWHALQGAVMALGGAR